MRKRTLSLLIAGTLLFGTAAACGDDEETPTEEDGGSGSGSESEGGDEGGEAEGEGAAYCAEVEALVQQIQEDPTNPDIATQAQEVIAAAQEITDPEQAQIAAECSQEISEALAGG